MIDGKKGTITIRVVCQDLRGLNCPADEFLELLQKGLGEVPPEYRSTAMITMGIGYGDELGCDMEIHFTRPETDLECRVREQTEHERAETTESRQRREYERLRRKFEGSDVKQELKRVLAGAS